MKEATKTRMANIVFCTDREAQTRAPVTVGKPSGPGGIFRGQATCHNFQRVPTAKPADRRLNMVIAPCSNLTVQADAPAVISCTERGCIRHAQGDVVLAGVPILVKV